MKRRDTALMLAGLLLLWLSIFSAIYSFRLALDEVSEHRRKTLVEYGRKSRDAGIPANANPFKDTEGKWWLDGWMEAQETETAK